MDIWLVALLNGLSYGLLLFLLSAGLTLIFSMMGVLNFAHASFYMLGAYLASTVSAYLGFWSALFVVPLMAFALGAAFEQVALRPVRHEGHLPELLMTFGLSYVLLELVQLVWGRTPVEHPLPTLLQGPLWELQGVQFPRHRAFMMLLALLVLGVLWWLLRRTRIGLVVSASLTHPEMVQALGHDVPRIRSAVFATGSALAALAGVIGGAVWITEPAMAATLGPILFVVIVIGGLGSLRGALWASLLVGCLQSWAVMADVSLAGLLGRLGWPLETSHPWHRVLSWQLSDLAPVLPFLLLVLMLVYRPRGLMGQRDR